MRLLLDQGLPRSTGVHFRPAAIEAIHVGDIGLANATDGRILEYAREHGLIVVTLDEDFHARLALTGAATPSVIRVHIEGLRAEGLAALLLPVLQSCAEDLRQGTLISITEAGIRIRRLPLLR